MLLPACADNIQPATPPDAAAPAIDAAAIADAAVDAPVEPDDGPPLRLADTGLYFDFKHQIIHPRNVEYGVRFELWADGAEKRRWVRLPPGETIDTSDMDFWSMPVGTVLFKEFSRGGLLVETRMITKVGPARWQPATYLWNLEQDDALLDVDGAVDHLGTGHDVPPAFQCGTCHGGQPDFVLGFSAIQLDTGGAGFGLGDLIAEGKLSDPPAGDGPVYFPLPGTPEDQAALGYLHGNCGGCHFPGGNLPVDAAFRLAVASLGQVTDTPTYQTAVGVAPQIPVDGATAIIEPGAPESSAVHIRMESLSSLRMPPVATGEVDSAGLAAVDTFIDNVTVP